MKECYIYIYEYAHLLFSLYGLRAPNRNTVASFKRIVVSVQYLLCATVWQNDVLWKIGYVMCNVTST